MTADTAAGRGRGVCQHGVVPRFEPFAGVRFSPDLDPAAVTSPPYDVVDDDDRATLLAGHERNAVAIDIPREADGDDRYAEARRTLEAWSADGTLMIDPRPSFTVYRMDFTDDTGRPASTLGVIGAAELSSPGEGWILPHEHTTPKARTDRLDLIRATQANLSPVWMLSLAKGLSDLIRTEDPPLASWSDGDGVTHTSWRVDEPGRVAAIAAAVGAAPLVVADGHHRYETSLLYRDERRAAGGDGGADLMMALVVELAEDQLRVRPIHRLLAGLSYDEVLAGLTETAFTVVGQPVPAAAVTDGSVIDRMAAAGALAAVGPDGSAVLLAPRPDASADVADLDSARLAHALEGLPTSVTYQHGTDLVQRAVIRGDAAAGVLLRPAPVSQIEANAHSGERMPPKTTFFHPKPRTGVVFRVIDL